MRFGLRFLAGDGRIWEGDGGKKGVRREPFCTEAGGKLGEKWGGFRVQKGFGRKKKEWFGDNGKLQKSMRKGTAVFARYSY